MRAQWQGWAVRQQAHAANNVLASTAESAWPGTCRWRFAGPIGVCTMELGPSDAGLQASKPDHWLLVCCLNPRSLLVCFSLPTVSHTLPYSPCSQAPTHLCRASHLSRLWRRCHPTCGENQRGRASTTQRMPAGPGRRRQMGQRLCLCADSQQPLIASVHSVPLCPCPAHVYEPEECACGVHLAAAAARLA